MNVRVTLPDGSTREVAPGTTVIAVVEQIGRGLARAALAARVNGRVVDLGHKLESDCDLQVLTWEHTDGREVFRHTSTHIMAQAVKRLLPEARLTVGPPLEDSFYYDIDTPRPLTPDDLGRIEQEMAKIVQEDLPIEREELDREEAWAIFQERNEPFKLELLNDIPADEPISVYRQGEFIDLCAGPHLPSTGKVKAFKLLSVAGAYWRGDQNNKQLQRLYGTSFPKKEDLDHFLWVREEAKKRDHRKLGPELELFFFKDEAPGFAFWQNKGVLLYQTLENWSRSIQQRLGYEEAFSPWIFHSKLYETSGHWFHYRQNMFLINNEEQWFANKPMNCPGHCLIYKQQLRSYRDLPLKIAEYGPLSRAEGSGTLHGLLRVRGFHQDDAHLFVREDQIEAVVTECLGIVKEIYGTLGMQYEVKLSTRPDEFLGEVETWDRAEAALAAALDKNGIPYRINAKDGAFYGPKIDIDVIDALGRPWQCPTIQLDYQFPQRFELTYIGEDGKEHRPVMIHRAIMGSLERFIGILIEHFAGAFPVWLAPEQVRILPITDRQHAAARELLARCKEAGLRADLDDRNEKVGYKIRQAEVGKVPYMLILGDKEMQAGSVAVRRHGQGDLGAMDVEAFLQRIRSEIASRAL